MVSILMSTYNGEKYIIDQLKSIYAQSKRPDEVIIIDDCSKDNTVHLIKKFIKDNNLDSKWSLYENTANKGWKRNFIEGLSKISGDVVFFSDQDDIWLDKKIEVTLKVLNDTKCNVVASNEIVWMGDDVPLPDLKIISGNYIERNKLSNYLIHCSGCSMAINMEYVKKALPYYRTDCAHDDFFWKISLLDHTLYKINEALILHRIHDHNESRKKRNYDSTLKNTEKELQVISGLMTYINDSKQYTKDEIYQNNLKLLIHKKKGYELRKRLLVERKVFLSILLIIKYSDIFRRKREILKDIFLTLKH